MGLGDMLSRIFNNESIKDSNSKESGESIPPVESVDDKKVGSLEEIDLKYRSAANDEGTLSPSSTLNEDASVNDSKVVKGDSSNENSTPAEVTEEQVLEVLSDVYDPEIPIDIVNLGLIYGVEIKEGNVHLRMTMTAPGCPSSAEIAGESKILIEELPGVKSARIEIVWDPPWDPSRMSEEARQSMGL